MPKRYRGVVQNGVVMLEPGAQLADGTPVEVVEVETAFAPNWEIAWRMVGIARDREQCSDVSQRVDEYLLQEK